MLRSLRILHYYFSWQRTMRWVVMIGAVLFAIGMISPVLFPLRLLGDVFAIGFPVMTGGLAYRQIVSNRRFALVPGIRVHAAVALFLLAVTAAAAAWLTGIGLEAQGLPWDSWTISLHVFSYASLYLVATQWMITNPAGLLAFGIAPIVALRLIGFSEPIVAARLAMVWPWLSLAVCAWAWLLVIARRPGAARPPSGASWAGFGWSGELGNDNSVWLPRAGPMATALGTMMRGARDGLRNRLLLVLTTVLAFPVTLILLMVAIGAPLRGVSSDTFLPMLFLLASFYGVCTFSSMVYSEWPARLRLVWLRSGGSRDLLWRRLERTLFAELVLIAATVVVIGLAFLLLTGVRREFILLYVVGSCIASVLTGYMGFWIRVIGWHTLAHALLLIVITIGCFMAIMWLRSGGGESAIWYVLPGGAVLAAFFRLLARRGFLRMDWCAIRPARRPRTMLLGRQT